MTTVCVTHTHSALKSSIVNKNIDLKLQQMFYIGKTFFSSKIQPLHGVFASDSINLSNCFLSSSALSPQKAKTNKKSDFRTKTPECWHQANTQRCLHLRAYLHFLISLTSLGNNLYKTDFYCALLNLLSTPICEWILNWLYLVHDSQIN